MIKGLEELKRLLIVVDMVNGFVKEGKMADKEIAKIIPEQLRLIKEFIEKGDGVAFIKDSHNKNSREFKRYPEHCEIGTSESELVDELKPFEESSLVYEKNSTSALFAERYLSDIERMKKLEEIVVVGCCTDICVLNLVIPQQNYFDQNNRDVEIVVPMNAVETYDAPFHNRGEYNDMAFKLMNQAGIKLVKRYGGK